MSTPTIERSEMASESKLIPERDEELEKYIDGFAESSYQNLWDGEDGFSISQLRNACEKVAAFSAKREREKVIEEVCERLSRMALTQKLIKGEEHISTQVLRIALDGFEKLKPL